MSARALATCLLVCSIISGADLAALELWPFRVAVLESPALYVDPRLDASLLRRPNLSFPALTSEIERLFGDDPRFITVPEEAIRQAMVGEYNSLVAMSGSILRDRGIEEFGQYNLDSAIDSLTHAISNYQLAGALMVSRRDVAMAYEYLARAYLERSYLDPAQAFESRYLARQALMEMIRLLPTSRMGADRYPLDVVQMYSEAYIGLLADNGSGLLLSAAQAEAYGRRHALEVVVFPYFIGDAQGVRLVLQVVNLVDRAQSAVYSIGLTLDTESSSELVGRLVSQVTACVSLRFKPPSESHSGEAGRFFLQVGWGGGVYGSKPTRSYFFNQGVVLQMNYQLSEYLAGFLRTNVMYSGRDPEGHLLDGFTSLRSALGLLFSYRYEWFRGFVGIGVEGNRVGAFRATSNFWCKVSGGAYHTYAVGMACLASEVITQRVTILIGPHVTSGVSFDVAGPFALFLAAQFSFYLSDVLDDTLGFPLGVEAGIQYRF